MSQEKLLSPDCLPAPDGYEPPKFAVPAQACDTHFHVTPTPPWHTAPDASYQPVASSPASARRMQSALGLSRAVVVQASVFGVDNRGVLEALAAQPGRLRGTVVLGPAVTDAEIETMHAMGVRGYRCISNGLGATMSLDTMRALAPRVAEYGWHVEILPALDQWQDLLPILVKLPTRVVIDHMGGIPAEATLDHPACKALRRLVRERGACVKLIGSRVSADPLDPRLIERAQALYEDGADGMVWGTDWPHVGMTRMPDAGSLLNAFAQWFDHDKDVLSRILATNPASIFDF